MTGMAKMTETTKMTEMTKITKVIKMTKSYTMSSKIQRKEDNIREGADVIHKVQHSCNIAMLEIEHFFWTLHIT